MSDALADPISDADLIERAKGGDAEAFAGLWRRHAAAGRTVARSFSSSLDPDDLVSEAFTRVYQQLQKGKGPTGAFRPYLFTTIRNTAASWGRARRETSLDTLESFEDPESSEGASLDALDRSLTATAFQSLPTRWQEALWYSEVEAMTPQQIGPLLGMSANSVAALCYRAREGLRRSWIQAHLNAADTSPECRWTIERLGSYARGGLGQRETRQIEDHLDGCAKCTIVAAEAKEVGSRLALVLLPLAAGIGGAAAYTSWLQMGATDAVLAAAMPASVTGGAGSGAAGSTTVAGSTTGATGTGAAGSTTVGAASASTTASGVGTGFALTTAGVVTAVVGTLALAATVVVAVTLGPTMFPGAPAEPDAVIAAPDEIPGKDLEVITTPDSGIVVPVMPPVVPAPPLEEFPGTGREDASGPEAPPVVEPEPVTSVPEIVDPGPIPSPSPTPTPTPTPSPTPTPTPTPSPQPSPEPIPVPEIGPIDNGGGRYFPMINGMATSGSVMELFILPADLAEQAFAAVDPVDPGEPSVTVNVEENGAWGISLETLGAGAYSVTVRERQGDSVSAVSEPQSFEILPPPKIERISLLRLRVTGIAGAGVEWRSASAGVPWESRVIDESGEVSWLTFLGLFEGNVIAVRYSDGIRFGPELAYVIPPIFSEHAATSGLSSDR